jgi:response regulator RpfG family c-di-GMP phosphodiesterase
MQVQASTGPETLTGENYDSLRILIVDDEPTICETLRLYLEHLGIQSVHTANDGRSAVELLGKQDYDFVFLDMMLPEMNGMEVLQRLQSYQKLTSVILMTGYPSMEIAIDAMHNGASDFLIKPFRFQDIKITLNRIQQVRHLMEKNWQLHKELEAKKEVEELNRQLEKRIRYQGLLYHIVDSISKISQSDDLYQFIVNKAAESCNASKACFLMIDPENGCLIALAQKGFSEKMIGEGIPLRQNGRLHALLDHRFSVQSSQNQEDLFISLDETVRRSGIVTVPLRIRNEPFGLLFVGDKGQSNHFDSEDEFILSVLAEKTALNIENMALYDNLRQNLFASLGSLVGAIEAKDAYTQQHSHRVTLYAVRIAERLGCSVEDIQRIETSGPLHDIGKIGIKDMILNKPGRLTDEEFKEIMGHPLIGANIIQPLGLDEQERAIVRNHHERWDGRGYPDGLDGENIPRLARILTVADSFDAMSSSRAYRSALPLDKCIQELKSNSGSQFDPEIVEAALEVLPGEKVE